MSTLALLPETDVKPLPFIWYSIRLTPTPASVADSETAACVLSRKPDTSQLSVVSGGVVSVVPPPPPPPPSPPSSVPLETLTVLICVSTAPSLSVTRSFTLYVPSEP